MATRGRDSTLRKEKRVTSSSNSSTTSHRQLGRVKSASTGSIDKEKPSSSKQATPSYLRPTLSSRTETSKQQQQPQVKKNAGSNEASTTQKSSLLRRRSFDRPPPGSLIQKTLMSPDMKGRQRPSSQDRTTIRSSSFSSKTPPTSPKPVLDRNSRSFKPVNSQQGLPSRTISRTVSLSKNNARATSLVKQGPSSLRITETLNLETEKERSSDDSFVLEADHEMVNIESKTETVPSESKETNKINKLGAIRTQVNDDDDNILNFDNCTGSEGSCVSPTALVEIVEDELHGENSEPLHQPEENHTIIDESSTNDHDLDHSEDCAVEEEADHDKGEANANKLDDPSEELVEEQKGEEADRGEEASEEVKGEGEGKSKEGEDVVVVVESVEDTKEVEGANKTPQLQGGHGKKESPTAYNDVIEETKNKLLEKRKNKVKALVGAFETVIDYETAASK